MSLFDEVAARLGGVAIGHEALVGGVSARVTALDVLLPDDQRRRVVVREPGAADWRGAGGASARREFDLLERLHRAGLLVPSPLLIDGHEPPAFFVMDFVSGTPDLPDQGVDGLAALLALIHAAPLEPLPALPEREDPIAGLLATLGTDQAEIAGWLTRKPITLTPRRTLLHGDFWPGNVLWRDGELVAVLDWEDAAVGDPLSDVACARLELRYVAGVGGTDRFTRAYAEHARRGLEELPIWDAYVAAAALASMGQWGLSVEREARMRQEAEASFAEAIDALRGRDPNDGAPGATSPTR